MKKGLILLTTCLILLGCHHEKIQKIQAERNTETGDRVDRMLDLILEEKDQNTIEFPLLYDSLCSVLPSDSSEHLILAEKLKKRGFKVVNWGRGNFHPLGQRIVSLTLKKGDCYCDVSKIYYFTISDTYFEMRERIVCSDQLEP